MLPEGSTTTRHASDHEPVDRFVARERWVPVPFLIEVLGRRCPRRVSSGAGRADLLRFGFDASKHHRVGPFVRDLEPRATSPWQRNENRPEDRPDRGRYPAGSGDIDAMGSLVRVWRATRDRRPEEPALPPAV